MFDNSIMEADKPVKRTNPWLEHVKKVREKNPGKSLKEIMVKAKDSYKKK
jgi:hypothetical protein